MSGPGGARLHVESPDTVVAQRFARSNEVAESFFETHASRVSTTCLAMARRFRKGGRLLVFGSGAAATDAHHVSVEFVHPVLVGKRALPAIALTADAAMLSSASAGSAPDEMFARALGVLARRDDIAMGISHGAPRAAVSRALAASEDAGLLCVRLMGAPAALTGAHDFVVESADPLIVQEIQETLYHIFWELVHVFLDGGVT
jgi:D-sedoheptulose 7-phosphate isomerase